MFPDAKTLNPQQLNDVLTQYSLDCWEDLKPAAATLLNEAGIVRLQTFLEEIAGNFNDFTYSMTSQDFCGRLKCVYDTLDEEIAKAYSLDGLFQFLYSIGIFYTFIIDGNGKRTSFACLGHQKPYANGKVRLHRTLVRAFCKMIPIVD